MQRRALRRNGTAGHELHTLTNALDEKFMVIDGNKVTASTYPSCLRD